jgi:hypothetical protein
MQQVKAAPRSFATPPDRHRNANEQHVQRHPIAETTLTTGFGTISPLEGLVIERGDNE